MRRRKPAGGDTPPDFLNKQPFAEKPSAKLRKTNVDIARHNLEVRLAWFKKETFRVAKEVAAEENEENTREMDKYVRKAFANDSRIIAEWEELMAKIGLVDDVIDD